MYMYIYMYIPESILGALDLHEEEVNVVVDGQCPLVDHQLQRPRHLDMMWALTAATL